MLAICWGSCRALPEEQDPHVQLVAVEAAESLHNAHCRFEHTRKRHVHCTLPCNFDAGAGRYLKEQNPGVQQLQETFNKYKKFCC